MDITFDPLTEDGGAGYVLDEEDEAAAEAQQPPGDILLTVRAALLHTAPQAVCVCQLTESCVRAPAQVTPAARAAFPADVHAPVLVRREPRPSPPKHAANSPLLSSTRTQVAAFGAVARALVHALPGIQHAGSVLLPELSLRGNGWLPRPTDKACCHLFTAPCGGATPLVLASSDAVPHHRAFQWAVALQSRFRPSALIVLDEAPLAQGATRTALARLDTPCCVLQTDVAAVTHGKCAVPLLTPGPLVVGAAAALMTQFQAAGKPGRCYVYAAPDVVLHPGDVARALVTAASADSIMQAASTGGAALQWDSALARAKDAGCFEVTPSSQSRTFT